MKNIGRARATRLHLLTGLLSEGVILVYGLLVPRLILVAYGSASNGLISSITQFLSFSSVLHAGIGGVTKAALFKPLADNDMEAVNAIMVATRSFMRKVVLIFLGLMLVFAVAYPLTVSEDYEWLYAFEMVLILSISAVMQNMVGLKNLFLLCADQKSYIQHFSDIAGYLVITVVTVVMIELKLRLGLDIDIIYVKLAIMAFSWVKPLVTELYVRKHYKLDYSVKPNKVALSQRWDAFAQQFAAIINSNIDVILITLLSKLKYVSVYTVHSMVMNNVAGIVNIGISNISSAFGNIMAKGEEEKLRKSFFFIEWALFALATFVFSVSAVMLTPFVGVYTRSIDDVSYYEPLFATLMVFNAFYGCLRTPYQRLVEAKGHFRQTRNGSILEVIINLAVSVALLIKLGLVGVAFGTLAACIIRTVQFSVYASKKILNISLWHVIIRYLTYTFVFFFNMIFCKLVFSLEVSGYFEWALKAIPVSAVCLSTVILATLIINKEELRYLLDRFLTKFKKKIIKK